MAAETEIHTTFAAGAIEKGIAYIITKTTLFLATAYCQKPKNKHTFSYPAIPRNCFLLTFDPL